MKYLIVIAEGVESSLLEKEIRTGNLPWFSKALNKGIYKSLECGPVPYEPTNLATAFTGVGPGSHGCFSYWAIRDGDNKPRVLTTDDVKAPRFWDWPSFSDLRFSIINVQLTHPPKQIRGNLITYPMGATLRASYPSELLRKLSHNGIRYAHDVTVFYAGQPLDAFANEANIAARYQLDTALSLTDDCDIMVVNLTLADRLSHFLWHEIEDKEKYENSSILSAYKFIDNACAALQDRTSESMLVFSEIGFGGLDYFVSIDDYFQRIGLQKIDEHGNVDLRRSVALESVQGSHGIILANTMDGRFKSDINDSAISEVKDALLSFKGEDGENIIESVLHKEEVYSGPWSHLAPDLIIKPSDPRKPPLGNPRWANHVRRCDQSGWHRDKGFILLPEGIGVNTEISTEHVKLTDITTIISHMTSRDNFNSCLSSW